MKFFTSISILISISASSLQNVLMTSAHPSDISSHSKYKHIEVVLQDPEHPVGGSLEQKTLQPLFTAKATQLRNLFPTFSFDAKNTGSNTMSQSKTEKQAQAEAQNANLQSKIHQAMTNHDNHDEKTTSLRSRFKPRWYKSLFNSKKKIAAALVPIVATAIWVGRQRLVDDNTTTFD